MDTALNLRDIQSITETDIKTNQFVTNEIFTRLEDIRVRFVSLEKAITLSGSNLVKTILVVNTINGFRKIETKIIGINETGIALEGRTFVPLHAIYSINIE